MSMSTKSGTSIEEYLRTSFEDFDREYVDGEIVERALPTNLHSEAQGRLIIIFWDLAKSRPFHIRPDLRLRVADARVRIPDISIIAGAKPRQSVPSDPALAVIEILSPDDRYNDLIEKFGEYERWGVKHLWMVDPERRALRVFRNGLFEHAAAFEIPEYDVRIEPARIFG
jgi:Uma2 family endonuclease